MAHAAGGAALQPAVPRFDHLLPNAAEYEWWESAWNVAYWFVAVGYMLIAVGAALFVGLTSPAQAPIVAVAAGLGLYPAANYADGCLAEARKYHVLAEIERGVAREHDNILNGRVDIDFNGNRLHNNLFPVAARYFYWTGEGERLRLSATAVLARPLIPAEWPQERRERYQQQLDAMPQNQRERFEHENTRRNRFEAHQVGEQLLQAKVYAAFYYGLLIRPDYPHSFDEQISFHLPPLWAGPEERAHKTQSMLMNAALSQGFDDLPAMPAITINRTIRNGREGSVDLPMTEFAHLPEPTLASLLVPALPA